MSEMIIGPNSCPHCGGEYGEHSEDCRTNDHKEIHSLRKEISLLKEGAEQRANEQSLLSQHNQILRKALELIANYKGTIACIPLNREASRAISIVPNTKDWVRKEEMEKAERESEEMGAIMSDELKIARDERELTLATLNRLRTQLAEVEKERDALLAKQITPINPNQKT